MLWKSLVIEDQTIDDTWLLLAWCVSARSREDAYNHITKTLHIADSITYEQRIKQNSHIKEAHIKGACGT